MTTAQIVAMFLALVVIALIAVIARLVIVAKRKQSHATGSTIGVLTGSGDILYQPRVGTTAVATTTAPLGSAPYNVVQSVSQAPGFT